jgi:hypothetical protein
VAPLGHPKSLVRCIGRTARGCRTASASRREAWRSGPNEIRVLGLQPIAAGPALLEAARPLRHDPLKAHLAGLGEHSTDPAFQRLRTVV